MLQDPSFATTTAMAEQTPPSTTPTSVLDSPEPDLKLYRPPASSEEVRKLQALPDSYFTPTTADLMSAQATLTGRTHALMHAPLQLRIQREATEKSKRDRWPNTVIRIRFMDRTQLEKTFPSTDKIRSVYAFVRSSLRDDVKHTKFILYQPPNRDLKVSDLTVRDLSLSELQLAPSSVLLFRFEDQSLNKSDVPAPLIPSIMAQATDLPLPPSFDASDSQQSVHWPSKSSGPMSQTDQKKIPKWFKFNRKK